MTQEGEKEIVLGNKQLISLFFVVAALCGVFFAMGYMLGRKGEKPAVASPEASAAPATNASSISPSPAPQAKDAEPPRETVPDETSPAEAAATDASQTTAPATAAAGKSTTSPAPETPAASVQTKPALDTPVTPEAGATWLQVTALRRADADNLVKTLREQNFPAAVASSSKPDLFRVLVGPYHQTADVADAKARLKALGFANAFVQK